MADNTYMYNISWELLWTYTLHKMGKILFIKFLSGDIDLAYTAAGYARSISLLAYTAIGIFTKRLGMLDHK